LKARVAPRLAVPYAGIPAWGGIPQVAAVLRGTVDGAGDRMAIGPGGKPPAGEKAMFGWR
jgi:hypothetical protein